MRALGTQQRRLALVLGAAVVLAALLVGASLLGGGEDDGEAAATTGTPATTATTTAPGPSLFAGLEQDGGALGAPDAPVTLVEFADLQCPFCAQWATDALPTLVEDFVRTGKLRIVFSGMAFIGPDSDKALRTVLAAGQEDHLWDVLHGLYERQGQENAGWVTDDLVRELAAGVPGLDGQALLDGLDDEAVEADLRRATMAADLAGISSTPSFQVGLTGGELQVVQVQSLDAAGIVPAIEAALAQSTAP